MITFHIISIFPHSLDSYINESILGRAQREKKIKIKFYNPRDFIPSRRDKPTDKYRRVDDRPYGGGPGMVMLAEPILKAVESIIKNSCPTGRRVKFKIKNYKAKCKIIILSPGGKQFTNQIAKTYAKKYSHIILISGRYEGIDARVRRILRAGEVSVGPYILTGGELPAAVVMDTIARQIPGVLGKFASLEEGRVSSSEVYTRPEILKYKGKKYKVPAVLLSGHQKKIESWKLGKLDRKSRKS